MCTNVVIFLYECCWVFLKKLVDHTKIFDPQHFDRELIKNRESNFEKLEKIDYFNDRFNRSSINLKKIGTTIHYLLNETKTSVFC